MNAKNKKPPVRKKVQISIENFNLALTQFERRTLERLTSPSLIQAFLDETVYSAEVFYRYPLRILHERTAHCFDVALFAAAALRRLGYPRNGASVLFLLVSQVHGVYIAVP